MERPVKREFKRPEHIDDYPVGPQFEAGFLAETNAGWRTYRPEVDMELCVNCLICYMVCPDGAVMKKDGGISMDYDYCKGCGVCAHECPKNAITMVKEEL
ncbi:MAG: 4Fe-4S binding protein [Bacteroidota bacterium]